MTPNEKITLWLSVIATGTAVLSMIISISGFFLNRRSNKAALLHQVKTSIDDAKTSMENRTVEMSSLTSKKDLTAEETLQLETLQTVYESSLEKVINAYEDGCQKYYANLILKKEFKKSYFSDIRKYVEEFEAKFTGPVTKYTYILRLYREWHKPS